jgi:Tfp pilus assembly protein PilE
MGQQQLLIIILTVIVVGLAIVVGINLFQASSVDANRTAVLADLQNIASLAEAHWKKPEEMGGGGNSFDGFELPKGLEANANGTYSIARETRTRLVIIATGTEKGDDGRNFIKYRWRMQLNAEGTKMTITPIERN